MSEKFQIGVGRYRHDLECSFSPEDDISLQSVSKSIFNSDINPKHMDMPTLNLISSKTKNMESLSDKIDTSLGKYVHDVQLTPQPITHVVVTQILSFSHLLLMPHMKLFIVRKVKMLLVMCTMFNFLS